MVVVDEKTVVLGLEQAVCTMNFVLIPERLSILICNFRFTT